MGRRGCAGHMDAMWCHVDELARRLGVCAELARRPGFGPSLRGLPSDCLASSTARRSLRVDDPDCLTPSLARRPRG